MSNLQQRAASLPHRPGVYIFKNSAGRVIYVGKAIDIRKRVSSYFKRTAGPEQMKLAQLVPAIRDIDFIITNNEIEALILEATLIKKHRPRFNVMLKDDKGYPYIKLTNEEFPRLELTRRLSDDGAKYFGPYTSAAGVRGTIAFLQKVFPLRMCKQLKKGRPEPCMYFHIGRCGGACSGNITPEEYAANTDSVRLFLTGKHDEVLKNLRIQMDESSKAMHFERAAVYRDRLAALEAVYRSRQEVVLDTPADIDIVGTAADSGLAVAEVMFIRKGKMIGHDPFVLRTGLAESLEEITGGFLQQYYAHREEVPGEILLSAHGENANLIEELLTARRGGKVAVKVPVRGKRAHLVEMAVKNASQRLRDELARDLANREQAEKMLGALAKKMSLPGLPRTIAGFDISTIQGTNTVGSAVWFRDGVPDTSGYKKFIIKSGGRDDFSSMREMADRYFSRVEKGEWPAPDLLIVDGGPGQLSAVKEGVLNASFTGGTVIMCFAKETMLSNVAGRKNAVKFMADEQAVFMVQRVIAEAHRFAITFHRKKRARRMIDE